MVGKRGVPKGEGERMHQPADTRDSGETSWFVQFEREQGANIDSYIDAAYYTAFEGFENVIDVNFQGEKKGVVVDVIREREMAFCEHVLESVQTIQGRAVATFEEGEARDFGIQFNTTMLSDIDETLMTKCSGNMTIRPSAVPLLAFLKEKGIKVGIVTSRDQTAVDAQMVDPNMESNLVLLAPYITSGTVGLPTGVRTMYSFNDTELFFKYSYRREEVTLPLPGLKYATPEDILRKGLARVEGMSYEVLQELLAKEETFVAYVRALKKHHYAYLRNNESSVGESIFDETEQTLEEKNLAYLVGIKETSISRKKKNIEPTLSKNFHDQWEILQGYWRANFLDVSIFYRNLDEKKYVDLLYFESDEVLSRLAGTEGDESVEKTKLEMFVSGALMRCMEAEILELEEKDVNIEQEKATAYVQTCADQFQFLSVVDKIQALRGIRMSKALEQIKDSMEVVEDGYRMHNNEQYEIVYTTLATVFDLDFEEDPRSRSEIALALWRILKGKDAIDTTGKDTAIVSVVLDNNALAEKFYKLFIGELRDGQGRDGYEILGLTDKKYRDRLFLISCGARGEFSQSEIEKELQVAA